MRSYQASSLDVTKVKILSVLRERKGLLYFITDWLVILSCSLICEHFFSWPLYLITALIIASRQHALLVLVHDAAHYRITSSKTMNDLTANFFAGFPCFIGTHSYRLHHLQHHQHLNTELDPDWARKIHQPEWQFPMPKRMLARILFQQVLIGGYEWVVLTSTMLLKNLHLSAKDPRKKEGLLLATYFMAMFGLAIYFNLFHQLIFYWLIPLLTLFPLIQRIRSISEHFAVDRDRILNRTRNISTTWIERFFFSPHSVNWHLVHHLYPSVPHYNLEELHQQLMTDQQYAKNQHLNHSYFLPVRGSVLKDLISTKQREKNYSNNSTENSRSA
ncbi:MAG: hypothetical protein COT73_09230 [Bdellovibrio sp. CG10_big_fil_rev_8_21_14_0_10_47_8]|nr:MAG: hypothetical protein COT73_09230 [Bdellovibrio sp. CG10_big_fil_rev_8_21_14_0_10_47_8]